METFKGFQDLFVQLGRLVTNFYINQSEILICYCQIVHFS